MLLVFGFSVLFISITSLWFIFEVLLPLWHNQRPFVLWRMFWLWMKLSWTKDDLLRAFIEHDIRDTKEEVSLLYG